MNDTLFLLKKVVSVVLLPPLSLLLPLFAGLLLLRRAPRLARALLWFGTGSFFLLSLPITGHMLSLALEHVPPADLAEVRKAEAIVILGGGIRRHADEYGGDTLKWTTLERVRYGARLARDTGLPVLVTGGMVFVGTADADLMKETLEREFGVPVRWTESQSRDTHENAVNTAAILNKEGIRKVVLVTHGFHMPRALAEFHAVGLDVVPAPTLTLRPFEVESWGDLLPSLSTFVGSSYALHELLGQLALRMAGR
ncbi:MAG: YdcF family protein [Burkholderiales bacterium]|nr:YdcF family protein [Burkholderiales bacterium]